MICVVNGKNGKFGVDYGESSPHFRSSVSWSDYMKPFKKFLVEFTKCPLVVHALGSWTTFLKLDDFITYERVVFPPTMLILGSSFSIKIFGCGLVMDDYYGRVNLRLIPISCPLVLVSSMLPLA